jgi:hypothetical protein
MARRGANSFKRNDALRALRVARDGGLDPAGLEIVIGPSETTFRILAKRPRGRPRGTGERIDTGEFDEEQDATPQRKAKPGKAGGRQSP